MKILRSIFSLLTLLVFEYSCQPQTFSMLYDGNGNTVGNAPTDGRRYTPDAPVTVLGNTGNLRKTGCVFVGWNTRADGIGTSYLPGVVFSMGKADMTLFAEWYSPRTDTVTYFGYGSDLGSVPSDGNHYRPGDAVVAAGNPGNLEKIGYHLAGWNTQSDMRGVSYAPGAVFKKGEAPVFLYPVWIYDDFKFASSDAGIVITDSKYVEGEYTLLIPAGATGIADSAFHTAITGLTLMDAGQGMTALIIPASIVSIDMKAFYDAQFGGGISNLKSITVDPENSNYSSSEGVLYDKSGTELLRAPGATAGSFAIPARVVRIGEGAFGGCRELIGVIIPATVSAIGKDAFYDCTNLEEIEVDPANKRFASEAGILYDKSKTVLWKAPPMFSGVLTLPSDLTIISDDAFLYCRRLDGVLFPDGLRRIGTYAFFDCDSMQKVFIPEGCVAIGEKAFSNCHDLREVKIPASVTDIGREAFGDCWRLLSVTVEAATPPPLSPDADIFKYCGRQCRIHVPAGSVDAYRAAPGWSSYASLIVSQ